MNINDKVTITAPFHDTYPDSYSIIEIVNYEDGQVAYVLNDIGAFDIKYLEKL